MKGRKQETMTSDVSNVNLLAVILLIVQHVYEILVMTCTWSAVRLSQGTWGKVTIFSMKINSMALEQNTLSCASLAGSKEDHQRQWEEMECVTVAPQPGVCGLNSEVVV